MYIWEGGLKGYISVCNSGILSYLCVYVQVQSSLCVFVSGAGLLYENRGPLSTRLFRAPVFLRPNSGSTLAPVRHSNQAQILRDTVRSRFFWRLYTVWSRISGPDRIAVQTGLDREIILRSCLKIRDRTAYKLVRSGPVPVPRSGPVCLLVNGSYLSIETACPWWLLIYGSCLFLVVTCPWWPLVHGGCLFIGAIGLRRLLVYGGSLFMAVACQWQVLVHEGVLFIGAAGSWRWLVHRDACLWWPLVHGSCSSMEVACL